MQLKYAGKHLLQRRDRQLINKNTVLFFLDSVAFVVSVSILNM